MDRIEASIHGSAVRTQLHSGVSFVEPDKIPQINQHLFAVLIDKHQEILRS